MMDKLATEILTVAPGADTTLPACDVGYYALNYFLTGMLAVISPLLRGTVKWLPFTKPIIDYSISLLPFGR